MKDFYKLESKPDVSFQTYFGLSFYKNYNILINIYSPIIRLHYSSVTQSFCNDTEKYHKYQKHPQ